MQTQVLSSRKQQRHHAHLSAQLFWVFAKGFHRFAAAPEKITKKHVSIIGNIYYLCDV